MEQKTDDTHISPARAGSESPTSKCPICLSMIDNPSFTDICIHQFCYTCLCEWAKVKAVCPVCKQEFQSIAYNVQSYEKFDELPVKNLIVEDTFSRFQSSQTGFQINAILSRRTSQIRHHPQDARFRYRTTMTSDYRDVLRRLEENRITEELRNPLVRIMVNHRPFVFSSNARKAVYRTGLRVQHLQTTMEQVFSVINPQFFNDNPACKIRLSPWLQRELDVMAELSDIPVIGDTMLLINLIFSLLNTLKITSQSFYNKLYPYLRRYTLHFIQELYCFARSAPYTMPQYDSCVVYGDGTSGAIWSLWHRDKAHSNSSISTAICDSDREDVILIPPDRGFIPFVMRRHRRTVDESAATPAQRAAETGSNPHGSIDLVQEPSDSSSDVEVLSQEPPWDARRPIVITDSEEEATDREQRVESWMEREVKYPVSEIPREHQDQRMSRNTSDTGVSSVNEQRYQPADDMSGESEMQASLHKSQKLKRGNEGADRRSDISDMSVEEDISYRLKTEGRRNSSRDLQSHHKRDCQNNAEKLKRKDKTSGASHSREDHASYHSKDLGKHIENSSKEQSTSTEGQSQHKHSSGKRSRSSQRRHSKEHSRPRGGHRKRYSKERVVTSSDLSGEQPKVGVESCAKEPDYIYSRRLHKEHRERQSGHRKNSSSEFPSCSLEMRDGGYLKEQQPLQYTRRKRCNPQQTSHCDASEADVRRLSPNRLSSNSYVSSASNSLSSYLSIPNLSSACWLLASCSHSLVGEDVKRESELKLPSDLFAIDSFSPSYSATDSDIFPSNVCHQDSNCSSKVGTENNVLNNENFVRKTYFWSDEEENSEEDSESSKSKSLKSQIGCVLRTGNGGALSALKPLSEELIVIESSDCSSSSQHCLSKDDATNHSHKDNKRKHKDRCCMRSKNANSDSEQMTQTVSRDSSSKESSCSRENQQSKNRRLPSYKKHKTERGGVDKDLERQTKTNHSKNYVDVGLFVDGFDENAAQYKVSDVADNGISHNKPVNVAAELLTFKKHFTGHKNLLLKTTQT